eukprot:1412393-Rhodomonas_salina.4
MFDFPPPRGALDSINRHHHLRFPNFHNLDSLYPVLQLEVADGDHTVPGCSAAVDDRMFWILRLQKLLDCRYTCGPIVTNARSTGRPVTSSGGSSARCRCASVIAASTNVRHVVALFPCCRVQSRAGSPIFDDFDECTDVHVITEGLNSGECLCRSRQMEFDAAADFADI